MDDPELYLAYDGSINSDWVARYALHLSRNTATRQLTLLQIMDNSLSADRVVAKVQSLSQESERLSVALKIIYLQQNKSVTETLLDAIPWGANSYCICGARMASHGRGYLAGTISNNLLLAKKFNTLVLRVVNPGLLGCPANVMFPLCGHPRKFAAAVPFFRLLQPCIKRLVLLRIMTFHPLVFRYLSADRARKAMLQGASYLRDVMAEIEGMSEDFLFEVDDHVLISDDWVKEVLVQAGKVLSGLILLGASDRLLQSRFYYGNKIEQLLRRAPCDVGIYRKI